VAGSEPAPSPGHSRASPIPGGRASKSAKHQSPGAEPRWPLITSPVPPTASQIPASRRNTSASAISPFRPLAVSAQPRFNRGGEDLGCMVIRDLVGKAWSRPHPSLVHPTESIGAADPGSPCLCWRLTREGPAGGLTAAVQVPRGRPHPRLDAVSRPAAPPVTRTRHAGANGGDVASSAADERLDPGQNLRPLDTVAQGCHAGLHQACTDRTWQSSRPSALGEGLRLTIISMNVVVFGIGRMKLYWFGFRKGLRSALMLVRPSPTEVRSSLWELLSIQLGCS
jgi:hypothetical protein